MNWDQAVECMKQGHAVRRRGEQTERKIFMQGQRVTVTGVEPCRLVAAWSVDNAPVMVFQGLFSREMFIPDEFFTQADDWVIFENTEDD